MSRSHWHYVNPPVPVIRPPVSLIRHLMQIRIPFPKQIRFIEVFVAIALIVLFVWNTIRWLTWTPGQ